MRIEIPGKWILAGEHAVVRGSSALVFPLHSRSLTLDISQETAPRFAVHVNSLDQALQDAAMEAFAKAQELLSHVTLPALRLSANFASNIPVGAGLGSSAALCVAIGKVFNTIGALEDQELPNFARELENVFHGTSSGLDISAVLAAAPLVFSRHNGAQPFAIQWQPELYLVDTGVRSSTKNCVQTVAALLRPDLDQRMSQAVTMAQSALAKEGDILGLAEALQIGQSCYRDWGLVPKEVADKIEALTQAGALACKLTGSGGGGFLLTLWKQKPPAASIACFNSRNSY
jgi:mevalonate kinase